MPERNTDHINRSMLTLAGWMRGALITTILGVILCCINTPASLAAGPNHASTQMKGMPIETPARRVSLTLTFMDERGAPIPDVRLMGYVVQPSQRMANSLPEHIVSNGRGEATLQAPVEGEHLLLVAVHPDYRTEEREVLPSAKHEVVSWTLHVAAKPISGTVIDVVTQQPVLTARIKGSSRPPRDGITVDLREVFSPTVSAEGRFIIRSINPDWSTTLQVTAPGYVSVPVKTSPANAPEEHAPITYELVRGLRISGKITDPNGLLAKATYFNLSCRHAGHTVYQNDNVVWVSSSEGKYRIDRPGEETNFERDGPLPAEIPFSIGELPAGPVTLQLSVSGPDLPPAVFGSQSPHHRFIMVTQTFDLTADREGIVIYGGPPVDAPEVDIVFNVTNGMPAPNGELHAEYDSQKQVGCIRMPSAEARVPIENGRAHFRLPAAGWISLHDTFIEGYRFSDQRNKRYGGLHIQARNEEIVVNLIPAGSLDVTVFGPPASAKPVLSTDHSDIRYQLWSRSASQLLWTQLYNLKSTLTEGSSTRLNALPLDRTYRILAWDEDHFATSEEVESSSPGNSLAVRFVDGETLEGRITDSSDRPVTGLPVNLECSNQSLSPHATDADGRFVIPHINRSLAFDQWLRVPAHSGHQPIDLIINKDTPPVLHIKLARGHVVTGIFLDGETGKPVEGVTMNAYPRDTQPNTRGDGMPTRLAPSYPVDGPTDAEGRFRFSNLPDGRVDVYAGYPHDIDAVASRILQGGRILQPTAEPNGNGLSLSFPAASDSLLELRTLARTKGKR